MRLDPELSGKLPQYPQSAADCSTPVCTISSIVATGARALGWLRLLGPAEFVSELVWAWTSSRAGAGAR